MYYINISKGTNFTIKFIPREDSLNVFVYVDLINEQTNTTVELTILLNAQGDYKTIDLPKSNLVSNTFYTFIVRDSATNVLYADRIFASNVASNDYDINKDQYITEQLTNNDYIVI